MGRHSSGVHKKKKRRNGEGVDDWLERLPGRTKKREVDRCIAGEFVLEGIDQGLH